MTPLVVATVTLLGVPHLHLSPTSTPGPHLHKRHFYTCSSSTLSWEPQWYTEGWYTLSAASYDRAASIGPVDPPASVVDGAGECQALTLSGVSSVAREETTRGSGSSTVVVVTSTLANGVVTTLTTAVSTPSASTLVLSTDTGGPLTPLPTFTNTSPTTTDRPSIPSSSASATTTADPSSGQDGSSKNLCAGEWDYQAFASVSASLLGVVIGGIMWAAWAILRGRLPKIYSPRGWYTSDIPSKWSWAAFLLPFLRIPSPTDGPPTPSSASLSPLFAILKLASLASLLALAAALQLVIVGVPCLSATSPVNLLGGRLGTLTDLSLLRLLNALDPSPGSPPTPSTIRLLLNGRALPSTIGPAISIARVRLIVVMVLIALLSLVCGLWVVARTYAGIARYRKYFRDVVCGGMEMVILPSGVAGGLEVMGEEKVRKKLRDIISASPTDREEEQELEVIGVFAIPRIPELRQAVLNRDRILHDVEMAEADFIASPSSCSSSQLRLDAAIPHTSSGDLHVPLPSQTGAAENTTKFHEVNRNSHLFGRGPKFEIGQAIKVDPEGRWVPDPSPTSEESHQLESGVECRGESRGEEGEVSSGPKLVPGPAHQPEIVCPVPQTSAHASTLQTTTPSFPATPTPAHPNAAISRLRGELQVASQEVLKLQQAAFGITAVGGAVDGWVVVGRGVQWIPGAVLVEGRTKEDIIWHNVGMENGERRFVFQMMAVGVVLALLLVPFIGLTNAAAPGFAHYLSFLRPVAESNGLGAGIAGGLVPAIVLSLVVVIAIASTEFLSRRMNCISESRRQSLQFKAVFWLLFGVVLIWTLLVGALEFAVQGFASGIQESRTVGDGAIFSTWWTFVFLLNIALIVPAIYLLQPRSLLRSSRARRGRLTPRDRFRRKSPSLFLPPRARRRMASADRKVHTPASFNPVFYLAAPLLCVFYAETLLFLFPLLAIPLFILLYLSFVAIRHMREYVFVDPIYSDGSLMVWTIRRLGWGQGLQPWIFGLLLLTRREWAIGGVAMGVGVVAVGLAEVLTSRRYPDAKYNDLSAGTRRALDGMAQFVQGEEADAEAEGRPKRGSNRSSLSVLQRVAALLPGYSRLPDGCPLPLETEVIDDRIQTERASFTRPDLVPRADGALCEGDGRTRTYFHDPTKENRGLIYPSPMLLPTPLIWLPFDSEGVARREAQDLEGGWGLPAIVDPPPRETSHRGNPNARAREKSREGGEVGSPLLE